MDWRVRTAWCLLVAVLLVSVLTPAEADHRSEGKGRESRSIGGHSSGSASSWNKVKIRGRNSTHISKPIPVHTTLRPRNNTKPAVSGSYNKSHDPFQTGKSPGHHQPTQWPPHPTSTTGGTGSKPVNNSRIPAHNVSRPGHLPGYLGYPGYNQHPTGYPGSKDHHLSGNYSGSGSQWNPPGYNPSFNIMPGIFINNGGVGPSLSSNRPSPFGYSENFNTPSSPTIIVYQISHYHYPSSIPPENPRGCDCYVKNRTAVCTYKLKDDHIPSCVDSSVTALFIRSKDMDQLAIDAFKNVRHLEYINITGTMLRLLPRDLLRDTPDLKHLVVRRNPKLRYVDSDVFRGASKLEDVFLDRNNISSLERDVFTHLTNVRKLNLGYNKIRMLPEGIFRDNRELKELRLSGNPLHIIPSYTARGLLRNNTKLRVLLMRNCALVDLPLDLLRNLSNLEWLDLSYNKLSMFPSEIIQDSPKLAHLSLAYNKLKVFSSDLLHQHGGSLASLGLERNPWHCDCDLLPLAGWASFRKDAVPGRPKCSSPSYVEKQPLQRWFHSRDATKCSGTTASLRRDLNRLLSVARAIAKQGPSFSANLLPISDEEVSFIATNYFSYAVAAETDVNVDSLVWHWARLLEKVLDRQHLRYIEKGINQTSFDPLTTTTTKPPAARAVEQPRRLKGYELLTNFIYVTMSIPENVSVVLDNGIEEELKILFGVINGTNATSPNATAANAAALNSTGLNATTSANGTAAPPDKLNATEQLVAGLRSELREVFSTLVQSIDRANWDAAYERWIEELEKNAESGAGSAHSRVLMQSQLTVLVAFLTLGLAHSLV